MTHKYTATGLDCPNCAKKLSGMIEKIEGVESVKLNFLSEELTVVSDAEAAALDKAVKAAGREFSRKVTIDRK